MSMQEFPFNEYIPPQDDTVPPKIEEQAMIKNDSVYTKTLLSQGQQLPVKEADQQTINPENPIISQTIDSINCDTVAIVANVETVESCEERASGRLLVKIESEKGTVPPYFISIDYGKNYKQLTQVVDLYPGNYSVWLKDNNNCLSKIGNFLVGSKVCDYDFIFAPDKGERWRVPTKEKSGTLSIYTKQGMLVYTEDFIEGQEFYWDGHSLNDIPQPMGVYRFILKFKDGEPIVGNVTIVR